MSTDDRSYVVVANDEDQYSIWPSGQDIPPGWTSRDFTGAKDDCLAHIAEVWTDLRPRSLRERLQTTKEGA